MNGINISAYTEDISQIEAIKAILEAMKIKYEISKYSPYKKEFVDMVLAAEEEIKKGKRKKVSSKKYDDLWK